MATSRLQTCLARARQLMGTITGGAITYSVYKTVLGGRTMYVRRAKSEEQDPPPCPPPPPPPSSSSARPPFDTEELLQDSVSTDTPSFYGKLPPVPAKDYPKSQPSVFSHDKAHALFLWIRVSPNADRKLVASSLAKLQSLVDQVEAPAVSCCGNPQILAGVGFGPEFYNEVKGGAPQAFSNANHKLLVSDQDQQRVGGDVLVHAKSNREELLQLLTEAVMKSLPPGSVQWHCQTYGHHHHPEEASRHQCGSESLSVLNYQYSQGQLQPQDPPGKKIQDPALLFVEDSGCRDTTPQRRRVAVDPNTGGSYVMTQRWEHDVPLTYENGRAAMQEWLDKAWEACAGRDGARRQLKSLPVQAAELGDTNVDQWLSTAYKDCRAVANQHPEARVVCTPGNFTRAHQPPFKLLWLSLPYRALGGVSGMFFISYSCTPRFHELLLDRLVASTRGGDRLNRPCCEVLRVSRNVQSACWYFPGVQELSQMV